MKMKIKLLIISFSGARRFSIKLKILKKTIPKIATKTKVNLPKMNSGALDVVWLIVYTKQGELNSKGYSEAAENAQAKFDAIHRLTEIYAPEKIG